MPSKFQYINQRFPIVPFPECLFGTQLKELGSTWFADLGPPFGVMYCLRCECVPVSAKRWSYRPIQTENYIIPCMYLRCEKRDESWPVPNAKTSKTNVQERPAKCRFCCRDVAARPVLAIIRVSISSICCIMWWVGNEIVVVLNELAQIRENAPLLHRTGRLLSVQQQCPDMASVYTMHLRYIIIRRHPL